MSLVSNRDAILNYLLELNPKQSNTTSACFIRIVPMDWPDLANPEAIDINHKAFSSLRYSVNANQKAVKYSYLASDTAPPVIISRDKQGNFELLDGLHRYSAAKLRGDKTILAYIGNQI